jgi:hypothetical protein
MGTRPWLKVASFLIAFLFCGSCHVYSQQMDTVSVFHMPIMMDEHIVRSGFDVSAFIKRVQQDTTFYKSFKSMHLVPCEFVNDIKVLDKHGRVIASLHGTTRQDAARGCRQTKTISEQITGDFYRNDGSYNYFTAALYDYLFFSKKRVCNQNDIVAGTGETQPSNKMEKAKSQLKQLIFNPGSRIDGVPLMGDKAALFDERQKHKYTFKIAVDTLEGTPCFRFTILPKERYRTDVVYNELTTWFRTGDFAILARHYSLSFNTLFYDFDVIMNVKTIQIGGKLYPADIQYEGNWHIMTRKRERVKFRTQLKYPQENN